MNKIFEINLEIYPESIIKQAILDFQGVAKINLNGNKLDIIWETEDEIDEVFNEFSNYIIWLINE